MVVPSDTERGTKLSQETLEVMDELALEISCAEDPEEKAELEHTLSVCREMAYAMAEGLITCEVDPDGELRYFPASA